MAWGVRFKVARTGCRRLATDKGNTTYTCRRRRVQHLLWWAENTAARHAKAHGVDGAVGKVATAIMDVWTRWMKWASRVALCLTSRCLASLVAAVLHGARHQHGSAGAGWIQAGHLRLSILHVFMSRPLRVKGHAFGLCRPRLGPDTAIRGGIVYAILSMLTLTVGK